MTVIQAPKTSRTPKRAKKASTAPNAAPKSAPNTPAKTRLGSPALAFSIWSIATKSSARRKAGTRMQRTVAPFSPAAHGSRSLHPSGTLMAGPSPRP